MKCNVESEKGMNEEIRNIEEQYQKTIQSISCKNIDFWGINVTNIPQKEITYKVYKSQNISQNRQYPLIAFLEQKGILGYYEDILDSTRPKVTRIDAALCQRNDQNIESLLMYLEEKVSYFSGHSQKVKEIAGMKITDVPNYNYASFHHLGLIEEKECVEMLKFYFFTRWCKNPEQFLNEGYRDNSYLEYLKRSDIREYVVLTGKAQFLLEKCGGHLWMAGMDISEEKVKYKIYLKNINHAYEFLMQVEEEEMKGHLHHIKGWNENHPECSLVGVALALDTENVSSVNLYFSPS